ncbi:MAG: AAA family ATPase [Thermodesulfobacteriota bacterium]
MKAIFVTTKNIKRFQSAIQRINHKYHGIERIALVVGEVGLGKTVAGLYFGVRDGATMLTVWPRMTQHWLLRSLARELGIDEPAWRTEKLIEQIRYVLIREPRTLIFDEVDHFFRDNDAKRIDALETMRKLHDTCGVPMVLIGEERINKKIERVPRLSDRIIEIVRFERYKGNDVKDIIDQLSDYRFEADAVEKIAKESDGRIRPIMRLIHKAETTARIHQLKTVSAKDF